MFKTVAKSMVIFLFIVAVIGCSSNSTEVKTATPIYEPQPLRVGVTPNYPPIIFKQNNKLTGVEVDFAHLLGKELKRPVKLIELKWKNQIPALLEGKTDIIMSGMSITKARRVRIDFTRSYLKSGLMIAMRADDAKKYNSVGAVMGGFLSVGVIQGTTGDVFAQRKMPNARSIQYKEVRDAITDLKGRRIELFIHDAPSIVWNVSENEADIAGLWEFLNKENLAWGVRKDDHELLADLNNILDLWESDGTLDKVINKRLPYLKWEH